MGIIDEILKETPDTKACRLGPGVTEQVAELFRELFPAATKVAVPKAKIDAVLFALHQTTVQLPVRIGDVIIPNVAETGVDVVATANM